jgi:hypothetical protein
MVGAVLAAASSSPSVNALLPPLGREIFGGRQIFGWKGKPAGFPFAV